MNKEGINNDDDLMIIDNYESMIKKNNFTDLLIAKKEYEFYQKELITQQKILDDKTKGFTAFLENQDPLYVKYNQNEGMIKQIQMIKEQIAYQHERNQNLKLSIEEIQKVINQKKKNIALIQKSIDAQSITNKSYKEQFTPNIKQLNEKLVYTNKSLYKKYLIEMSNIFFNRSTAAYLCFPPFYNQNFHNDTKFMRLNFYLAHDKNFSLFFGYIIYIISYLTKKFNITVPCNMYYNGSHSCVVINKGEFTKMYLNKSLNNTSAIGTEDMELGSKFLQSSLDEIINFLYNQALITNKIKFKLKEELKVNNIYITFINFINYLHDLLKENEMIHNNN